MKIAIFDLETTGLNADSAILLCAAIMPYGGTKKDVTLIRADKFPAWKKAKSNDKAVVEAVMAELAKYDILIAQNGSRFDRPFLNSKCLQHKIKPALRWVKFVDPCSLSWRHLRLHRNSLAALQAFLGIPERKTPVAFEHWLKASLDGDKRSLDYICHHCVMDVIVLDKVYDAVRCLIDKVDKGGSAY